MQDKDKRGTERCRFKVDAITLPSESNVFNKGNLALRIDQALPTAPERGSKIMGTANITLADLFYLYCTSFNAMSADASEAKRLSLLKKNLRSTIKITTDLLPGDLATIEAQIVADSLSQIIAEFQSRYPSTGSHSGHISRLRTLLSWGAANQLVSFQETDLVMVGFPATNTFFSQTKAPQEAVAFTLRFFTCCVIWGKSLSAVGIKDYNQFYLWCNMHDDGKRACALIFLKQWAAFAKKYHLRPLEPETKPAQKFRYGATLESLPSQLQTEIAAAIATLTTPGYKAEYGKRKLGKDSVKTFRAILLMYIGFIHQAYTLCLEEATLRKLIRVDWIIEFLKFTNSRSMLKADGDVTRQLARDTAYGQSQKTIITQMCRITLRYLEDPELLRQLRRLNTRVSERAESRREKYKSALPLDAWFEVAAELLIKSNSPKMTRRNRALLRRDAVIFVFLGLFSYRRGVLAKLQLDNVKRETSLNTIAIDRDLTKPNSRDLWHEVPEDFDFLLNHYLTIERPILVKPGETAFLVSDKGTALNKLSISTLVKRRMKLILDLEQNVHMSRKAWLSDFLTWSKGDYTTAMAVLDASRETLEQYYSQVKQKDLVHRNYDNFRADAAKRAKVVIDSEEGHV